MIFIKRLCITLSFVLPFIQAEEPIKPKTSTLEELYLKQYPPIATTTKTFQKLNQEVMDYAFRFKKFVPRTLTETELAFAATKIIKAPADDGIDIPFVTRMTLVGSDESTHKSLIDMLFENSDSSILMKLFARYELAQPTTNLDQIKNRQQIIAFFSQNSKLSDQLSHAF